MKELFIAGLFGLVIKLLFDLVGKFGWNVGLWKEKGFLGSAWINENVLRVIVAVLLLTGYILYMAEGQSAEDLFVYSAFGDYFLYNFTKPFGFKNALPKVMKAMGSNPKS